MKKIEAFIYLLKKKELFHELIINEQYFVQLPGFISNQEINHLSYSSLDSELDVHSLFIAKGDKFNREYLEDVSKKGVKFYLSEFDYKIPNMVAMIVSNVEKAMAIIARFFYDYPDKKIKIVGVTGTKGKTTTSYFLKDALSTFKKPAGLINSSEIFTGKTQTEAKLTTPESLEIYRYLHEMVEENFKYCVLEVSSQAYKRNRVYGLEFAIAVFLNFSPDHIGTDEHGSLEEYFYCKRQLLLNAKAIILSKELPHFDFLVDEIKEKNSEFTEMITFSSNLDTKADYHIQSNTIDEFTLIQTKTGQVEKVSLTMYGYFNHENAASSLLVGKLFNLEITKLAQRIKKTKVIGRFEAFYKNNQIVIVDYAHNETSFRNIIQSAREYYGMNRPFAIVTGSTGGKAENRRTGMAQVFSEEKPYKVYLAADDPNFTKVEDISEEIIEKTRELDSNITFDTTHQIDRQRQVEKALREMGSRDILFVLGKGTDQTQRVSGKLVPYPGDDTLVKQWVNS